jgi:hypothetical protein
MLGLVAERYEDIETAYQEIGGNLFDADDLRGELAQRDPDEAAFFTLVLVGSQIDNGGFAQLFTNTTGDLVTEAIAGAERLGLTEHAQLLRAASEAAFPAGVPLDHEARLRAWEQIYDERGDAGYEPIEALDERWYALSDALEQRLHAYAVSRRPS